MKAKSKPDFLFPSEYLVHKVLKSHQIGVNRQFFKSSSPFSLGHFHHFFIFSPFSLYLCYLICFIFSPFSLGLSKSRSWQGRPLWSCDHSLSCLSLFDLSSLPDLRGALFSFTKILDLLILKQLKLNWKTKWIVEVVTVADVNSRAIKPQKKFFISCLLSVFLHQWWWKIMLLYSYVRGFWGFD